MSNHHDNVENLEKHLANDARHAVHDLAHPIFGTRTGQEEHAYGAVGLQIGGRLIAQILHSIGKVLPHENGHPVWTDPLTGEKTVIPAFDDIRSAESKDEEEKIRELVENVLGYSPALKGEERTEDQAMLEDNLQRIARGSAAGGENEDADEINPLDIFNEIEAYYVKQGNGRLAQKAKAARLNYMDAKREKSTGQAPSEEEKRRLAEINDRLSAESRGQANQSRQYQRSHPPTPAGGGAPSGAPTPAGAGSPGGGSTAEAAAQRRDEAAARRGPQQVPAQSDEELNQARGRRVQQAEQRLQTREAQLQRLRDEGVPETDGRMEDARANVNAARENLDYARRQQAAGQQAGPRRGPSQARPQQRPAQATAGTTEASRTAEQEQAQENIQRLREQQAARRGDVSPEDVDQARAQRASDRIMRVAEKLGFVKPTPPAPDSTPTTPTPSVDGTEVPSFDKNQDIAAALARGYNSVQQRRAQEGQTAGRAEAAGANLGELRQQMEELDEFDLADLAAQAIERGEALSPEDLLIQEEIMREANRARYSGAGNSRRQQREEIERGQAAETRQELSRRFENYADSMQAALEEHGASLPENSPLRRDIEKQIEGARNAAKLERFESLLSRSDLAPEVKEGIQEQVNRLRRQGVFSAHLSAEDLVNELQGRPREKTNFRPSMQEQLYVALGRRQLSNRDVMGIEAFSEQFQGAEKDIRDRLNSEIDRRAKEALRVPSGQSRDEAWESLQSNENQAALQGLRRKATSEVARELYDNYRAAVNDFDANETPEALLRAAGNARGLLLANKKIKESYEANPKVYRDARRQIGQDAELARRDARAAAQVMDLGGYEQDTGETDREAEAREERTRRARAAEGDEGSDTGFLNSAKERLQALSGLGRGSNVSNNDVYDLYHNYIRGMSDPAVPSEKKAELREATSRALDNIFEDRDMGDGVNPRKAAQLEFDEGIFRAAQLRAQAPLRTLQGGGSARVNSFFRQGRQELPTLDMPDTVRDNIQGSIERAKTTNSDFVQNQVYGAPAMRQVNGNVRKVRLLGDDTEVTQNQLKASDVERYLLSQGINSAKIQVIPNSKDPDGTAARNNIGGEGASAPSLDVTVYDDPTNGRFIEGLQNLSTVRGVEDVPEYTGRLIYEGNQFLIGNAAIERIADQLAERGFRNVSIQTSKKIDPTRTKASKKSEIPTIPTLEISHSYGPEDAARLEEALKSIRYANGKGPVGGKVIPEKQDLRAPHRTVSISTSDPEIASRINGILLSSNIRNAYVRNQRSIFDTTEPAVEVELLDDMDDSQFEAILDSLGRQLPEELSFGLGDEAVWLNPHNPALKDRSPLYTDKLLDNLSSHLSQGTLHPADARILAEDVLPGLEEDLAVEQRIAEKGGRSEEAAEVSRIRGEINNIRTSLEGQIRQADESTGFVTIPNPDDYTSFNEAKYSRQRAEKGLTQFAENLRASLIQSGDFSRVNDREVRNRIQTSLQAELARLDAESPLKMSDVEKNGLIAHARRIATGDRSISGRLSSVENKKRARARVERILPKTASTLEEIYRDPDAFGVPERIAEKIKDGQYLTGDEHETLARIALRRSRVGEVIPTGPALGQVFPVRRNGETQLMQVASIDTAGGVPNRTVRVQDPNAAPYIPLGVRRQKGGEPGPEVDLFNDLKMDMSLSTFNDKFNLADTSFFTNNEDLLTTPEGRQKVVDQFNNVYRQYTTERMGGMHPETQAVMNRELEQAGGPLTEQDLVNMDLTAHKPGELVSSQLADEFKRRVALPITRVAHTNKADNPDYEFSIDMSDDRGTLPNGEIVGSALIREADLPDFTGDANFQSPTKTQEEDMNLNTPWDAQEDVPGGPPSRFEESLNIGKELRLADGRTVKVVDDQRRMDTAEVVLRPVASGPDGEPLIGEDGRAIPTGDPDETRSMDSNMFSELVYERPISPDAQKAYDIRTSPEEVISEAVRYSQLHDANRLGALSPQERLNGYRNVPRKLDRPPRVGVVGSRDGITQQQVVDFVNSLPEGSTVVSGGARGVDRWAEEAARARGLNVDSKKPQVDPKLVQQIGERRAYANAAFKRNGDIVNNSDIVVAFHAGESKGTADTLSKAEKSGTPYYTFSPEDDVTDFISDLEGNFRTLGLDISSSTSPEAKALEQSLDSGNGFNPRTQEEIEMPELIRERVTAAIARGDISAVRAAAKKYVEDGNLTRFNDILNAIPADGQRDFLTRVLQNLSTDPESSIDRIRDFVRGINEPVRAEILNSKDEAGNSILENLRRKASRPEPVAPEPTPTPATPRQTTPSNQTSSLVPETVSRAQAVAARMNDTFSGRNLENYLEELRSDTRANNLEAISEWEDYFNLVDQVKPKMAQALQQLEEDFRDAPDTRTRESLRRQIEDLESSKVENQDNASLAELNRRLSDLLSGEQTETDPNQLSFDEVPDIIPVPRENFNRVVESKTEELKQAMLSGDTEKAKRLMEELGSTCISPDE